jgi:hypothetical protein
LENKKMSKTFEEIYEEKENKLNENQIEIVTTFGTTAEEEELNKLIKLDNYKHPNYLVNLFITTNDKPTLTCLIEFLIITCQVYPTVEDIYCSQPKLFKKLVECLETNDNSNLMNNLKRFDVIVKNIYYTTITRKKKTRNWEYEKLEFHWKKGFELVQS